MFPAPSVFASRVKLLWSVVMPEMKRYRCNSCGYRFEIEVFTSQEIDEAEEKGNPLLGSPIQCPECNRQDNREGWD